MITPASILLRPVIPYWLLALAVVLFASLSWFTYMKCQVARRTRWLLWGLRMGALAIVVWLVLLPVHRTITTLREPSVLAVAVDVSASMKEKVAGTASRAERARAFLRDNDFERHRDDFRTVFFEVGAAVREREGDLTDPVFDAPRSNVVSGLKEIAARLRAEDVAGLVLLSDGLDHSGESLSAEARSLPVYALELEDETGPEREIKHDYFISELSYPEQAVVGWDARVDVLVQRRHQGDESCRVHLYREDVRIATQVVSFAGQDAFRRVSFDIHPEEPGDIYHYVELQTDAEDAQPRNNVRDFMIHAVDAENRVLYLEGVPRWEFKFFKRALLQETAYKVSAFVRGAKGEFVSFGEGQGFARMELPELTPENLKNYRVLVLGDLPETALNTAYRKNIAEFVEKGGGLLFIGGATAYGNGGIGQVAEFSALLPTVPDPNGEMADGRFQVDFTAAGRTHPAFQALTTLGNLPPILSVWRPVDTHEFASTLLVTADASPVITIRRFGEGRVAMLLSDSMWRWQLSGSDAGQKSFYNQFVTQLIHWLAPTERQMLEEDLLQVVMKSSEYELRRPVPIGATYGEGEQPARQLTCDIITPGGRRLTLPMQRTELGSEVGRDTPLPGFLTRYMPEESGKYQVRVSDEQGRDQAEARFLVKRAAREETGAPANRELLKSLAEQTGGRFVEWEARDEFLDELPNRIREIEISDETSLWDRFPWFAALVILFSVEWWLRRKHDLV